MVILDEPTNHLDVRAQLSLLRLLAGAGATTVVAVHDVNHALAYRVVVLCDGRVVSQGTPDEVITPDLMAEVFGVRASMITDPHTGRPFAVLGLPETSAEPFRW